VESTSLQPEIQSMDSVYMFIVDERREEDCNRSFKGRKPKNFIIIERLLQISPLATFTGGTIYDSRSY